MNAPVPGNQALAASGAVMVIGGGAAGVRVRCRVCEYGENYGPVN